MSFGLSRGKKIKIPTNYFFKALENAHVEPLQGSEYKKNDTLDKYIFEPINPINPINPMNRYKLNSFKNNLSPIEEVYEDNFDSKQEQEQEQEGGTSHDEDTFICLFFSHGGYHIDNKEKPVNEITRTNARLIVPGNKFDGYEYLTICGAAPPGQVNTGIGNIIEDVYHPVVMHNLGRFAELLTDKLSSVEIEEEPVVVKPVSSKSKPSYSSSSLQRLSSGQSKKGYKLPASPGASGTLGKLMTPSEHRMSRVSRVSRVSRLSGIVKSFSSSVKSKLYSLVSGCVKLLMNYNVDYSVLDLSDHRYVIVQKKVINAIICMKRNGGLQINNDLFDVFLYSLYHGLRKQDYQYFKIVCSIGLAHSTSDSKDCLMRQYALDNIDQRFPSVRVLVNNGRYQPSHVEKIYSYNPVNDKTIPFSLRIYKYGVVKKQNKKGEITILPKIDFFDIPIMEVFNGIQPDGGNNYYTTLSDASLLLSTKINQYYYGGNPVKLRLSIFDFSCSFFHDVQPEVPVTGRRGFFGLGPFGPKLGGRSSNGKTKRRSRRNKRNERTGRNERNNSKIRNRKNTRRTRKNRKNRKK